MMQPDELDTFFAPARLTLAINGTAAVVRGLLLEAEVIVKGVVPCRHAAMRNCLYGQGKKHHAVHDTAQSLRC